MVIELWKKDEKGMGRLKGRVSGSTEQAGILWTKERLRSRKGISQMLDQKQK
jgi:hypothetical protein